MLSFLNSSTIDSDDEKEKSSTLPKSDLDLYPPNLDENQLQEIEKLTADSLIDLINNVQKVWFLIHENLKKSSIGGVRTQARTLEKMLLARFELAVPRIGNLYHRTHHHLTRQLVGG